MEKSFGVWKVLEFGRLKSFRVWKVTKLQGFKVFIFLINFKNNAFCFSNQNYIISNEIIIVFINELKDEKPI